MSHSNTPSSKRAVVAFDRLHKSRGFFPTDRQRELCCAVATVPNPGLALVGYGGAMGGGKTRALAELALDAALIFPGNNILLARDTFTDLYTTTMGEFLRICTADPDLTVQRRSSPTHSLTVSSLQYSSEPSTIHFRHLSDWTGLGSQQYGTVLIDEAGEVAEEAAQMLLTRLRHPAQPQRWFVAASNPHPGWFERWFVQRELNKAELEHAGGQAVFIPAKIEDNPHLPDNYAEQQRALLPPDWVERFIEGRFDAFEGLVYPKFDPKRHLWDKRLPSFERYLGGLDFGAQTEQAHYTAGIVAGLTARYAVCGPNVLIRLAEFEDRGPGVTQRLEQWMLHCRRRFGSISWNADRSQSAWIDHLHRRGRDIRPSRGGPGSVHQGIGLVQERLSNDPPTSFYTPELVQFPRRMREYQWRDPRAANPQPRDRDDDLLDADRYCHELAQPRPQAPTTRIEFFHLPPLDRGRIASMRNQL